jgi:hypothetical protein
MTGMTAESREVSAVAGWFRAGQPTDEIVRHLRDRGHDVSDSIWLLVRAGVLPPGEAKRAVLESPVWADVKEAQDAFREALLEDLAAMGDNPNESDPARPD